MFQILEPARLLHKSARSSEGKPWAMENAISLGHCPWGWREGAEEGKNGAERQYREERGSESDRVRTLKPHNEIKSEMSAKTWPWNMFFGCLVTELWGRTYFCHGIVKFMPRCPLSHSHFPYLCSVKDKFLDFTWKMHLLWNILSHLLCTNQTFKGLTQGTPLVSPLSHYVHTSPACGWVPVIPRLVT